MVKEMTHKKQYFIMDGRARFDPNRAIVCSVCDSLAEAKSEMRHDYKDFDYVVVDGDTEEVVYDPNGR